MIKLFLSENNFSKNKETFKLLHDSKQVLDLTEFDKEKGKSKS